MTATDNNSPAKKPSYYGNWAVFDKNNTQHMYMLSLCRQYNWTVKHERYGKVADLERLSNWLKSDKSPVNKALKKMTPDELTTVICAFEIMVNKKYNAKK